MSTVADKIQLIKKYKDDIRDALELKGVSVDDNLSTYSSLINDLKLTSYGLPIDGITNEIIIDSTTHRIKAYAFAGYDNVYTVIIPSSITSIDGAAFSNSNIKEVTYEDKSRDTVRSMMGFPHGLSTSALVHCSDGDMYGSGAIVPIATNDGEIYFSGTTLIIGDNVTDVSSSYRGSTRVCYIKNQSSTVTQIEDNAFNGCSVLETYQDEIESETADRSLYKIGSYAFANCLNLETFDGDRVLSLGDSVFQNSGLTSITLPIATECGISTFQGCNNLTTINLPSMEKFGSSSFESTGLTGEINLPLCTKLGDNTFKGNNKITRVNTKGLESIGVSCFEGCSLLNYVNLADGVVIGNRAFANTGISNVSINAESLGDEIFVGNNNPQNEIVTNHISTNTLTQGQNTTDLIDVFASTAHLAIHGNYVDSLPLSYFDSSSNMINKIIINESELKVLYEEKTWNELSEITGTEVSRSTFSVVSPLGRGIIHYRKWDSDFRRFKDNQGQSVPLQSMPIKNLELPQCTKLQREVLAFSKINVLKAPLLTEIYKYVDNSSTSYSNNEVDKCTKYITPIIWKLEHNYYIDNFCGDALKGVQWYENRVYTFNQLKAIPNFPWGLDSSSVISVQDGNFNILGVNVYEPTDSLLGIEEDLEAQSCEFKDNVLTAKSGAQRIPAQLTGRQDVFAVDNQSIDMQFIDPNSFADCICLIEYSELPVSAGYNKLFDIGEKAFKNTALQSFTSVRTKKVGESAFQNCDDITSVSLEHATSVGDKSFKGCSELTDFTGAAVSQIGDEAFNGTKISSIELPSVEQIGDYVFANNSVLATVVSPNLKVIGNYAFKGMTSLTSIQHQNVKEVGTGAFWGCTNLQHTNGDFSKVTKIGENAFRGCNISFNTGDFTQEIESIGRAAFNSCSITSNNLKIKLIKRGAFWGVSTSIIDSLEVDDIELPSASECALCSYINATFGWSGSETGTVIYPSYSSESKLEQIIARALYGWTDGDYSYWASDLNPSGAAAAHSTMVRICNSSDRGIFYYAPSEFFCGGLTIDRTATPLYVANDTYMNDSIIKKLIYNKEIISGYDDQVYVGSSSIDGKYSAIVTPYYVGCWSDAFGAGNEIFSHYQYKHGTSVEFTQDTSITDYMGYHGACHSENTCYRTFKIEKLVLPICTTICDMAFQVRTLDYLEAPILSIIADNPGQREIKYFKHNHKIDSFGTSALKNVVSYENIIYNFDSIKRLNNFPWGMSNTSKIVCKNGTFHPDGTLAS